MEHDKSSPTDLRLSSSQVSFGPMVFSDSPENRSARLFSDLEKMNLIKMFTMTLAYSLVFHQTSNLSIAIYLAFTFFAHTQRDDENNQRYPLLEEPNPNTNTTPHFIPALPYLPKSFSPKPALFKRTKNPKAICPLHLSPRQNKERMETREDNNREGAQQWLDVATKLLNAKDLVGCKRFAQKAHEKDPLWDGVDQILVIVEVLLAAEKRINNHMDWYAILQLEPRCGDLELIKRQYKRFAFALHPDRNKSPFAENAFKLVSDAWAMLSDPVKKTLYDNELNLLSKFSPIVLEPNTHQTQQPHQAQQQPQKGNKTQEQVRRSPREKKKKTEKGAEWQRSNNLEQNRGNENTQNQSRLSTFWTVCPYCYYMYEYPRVYVDCVLRCETCKRGFHAAVIPSPPPPVPGTNGYYCSWAFFPIAYSMDSNMNGEGTPNWNPFSGMFAMNPQAQGVGGQMGAGAGVRAVDSSSEKEAGAKVAEGSDESWENGEKQKGEKSGARPTENGGVAMGGNVDGGDGMNKNVSKPGMRRKTVARRPKRQARKTVIGAGGMAAAELDNMGLNAESTVDKEEPAVNVDEGMSIESIAKEATEGIGFFDGLDDIVGTLPVLNIAPEQKDEEV